MFCAFRKSTYAPRNSFIFLLIGSEKCSLLQFAISYSFIVPPKKFFSTLYYFVYLSVKSPLRPTGLIEIISTSGYTRSAKASSCSLPKGHLYPGCGASDFFLACKRPDEKQNLSSHRPPFCSLCSKE